LLAAAWPADRAGRRRLQLDQGFLTQAVQ
jgi:hypothetical protein